MITAEQIAAVDLAIADVDAAGANAARNAGSEHVAFGLGDVVPVDWGGLVSRLSSLLDRLFRRAMQYERVETALGITVVNFRSDMDSVFAQPIDSDSCRLHVKALAYGLEYKKRLARLLVAAMRTAIAVVAAASFPTTIVSAVRSGVELAQRLEAVLEMDSAEVAG